MKGLLIFVGGLVVGAGATYLIQKNRYEEMVKEELDEMKEHYESESNKKCVDSETNMTSDEYDKIVASYPENVEKQTKKERPQNRYNSLTRDEVYERNQEEIEKNEDIININRYATSNEDLTEANKYHTPHIVTPEDFGSICGFDVATFYVTNDDVVLNDRNEQVDEEEIIKISGHSAYEINQHFGDYENDPDSVYIRNMELKIDYEFLKNGES